MVAHSAGDVTFLRDLRTFTGGKAPLGARTACQTPT
jgi:hypothetical protein